jgi:hypothetical protein
MVLEDLASCRRGVDQDAELGTESELVDWTVSVGQAGQVGVKIWVKGEKVPDQWEATWTRRQRWRAAASSADPKESENGADQSEEHAPIGVVGFGPD